MGNSVNNLNEIVDKLHEVDNVFKFGEKMIPVIEGFVSFITDFIPFIEQVSGSIQDTRSKIPEASSQIDKVTSATELAMTEVLDKIDEINLQLNDITDSIDEIVERKQNVEQLVDKLNNELNGNEKALEIFGKIQNELEIGLTLELIKNKVNKIVSDTDQITMSLQVQDITSQQLAAVNHMIISVQQKLGNLLSVVDSNLYNKDDDLQQTKLPGVHFDANASYTKDQQNDVDTVISNEKTSQDEIDKLFS